jgi:crotonobetainyl-CoA:carnitine CoA-transferase CaiB-like acyl-CoA transferase
MDPTQAPASSSPPAPLPREALTRAAASTGIGLDPATSVEVLGVDPILRSPMPIGLGASTLQVLIGQEVARIWERRGGRPQHLSVDARHAVTALRSYSLLELDGENLNTRRPPSPVTGLWKCADGRHIFLHESFADGPAVLCELGLSPSASPGALADAVARRGAFELEDALAASGLCAAVCRSAQEWRAHPHGALLAATPPVRITRIGDADPRPFASVASVAPGSRPLEGLRVLDLTRVLAGPVCGRTLAEHGADVLHIASPAVPTVELFEIDTGHGKRQAWLNLDERSDRVTLESLVAGADVFCQSYRPHSFRRRGLGPEDLATLRPGLIYVSESAYGAGMESACGAVGPWSGRPGWEQIAQTATGVAHLHGGAEPRLAPVAICDYTTGYFAALGVLAALNRRATEGGSWLVEVSLARSAMWYLELGTCLDPSRRSGDGGVATWMEERDTPFGRVRHVAPCLRMSETPPRWATPPLPLGSGRPEWIRGGGDD